MVQLAKLIAIGIIVGATEDPCADTGPVRVTVVVVVASSKHDTVDAKLVLLAREVQKLNRDLTGFRIASSAQKSIPVGKGHTFELVNGWTARVVVEAPKGDDGRIGLAIRLSDGTRLTYTCACDKFFTFQTPIRTREGDEVIVAVMAKPCTGK